MKKLLSIVFAVFFFALASSAQAALDVRTVFELNASATASNVNAGGFNPFNSNMLTDLTTDTNTGNTASPVVSSASYNFVAGDVGARVFIQSGTNWFPNCSYEIASVAANKATLNATSSAVCFNVNLGSPSPGYYAATTTGVSSVATPTGGTFTLDYSQGTAAIDTGTDLASSNGTTNPCAISSASHTFSAQEVGNLVHITAGTNWTTGWYEVVSVSAGAATLDRACGAAASISSGTWYLGGAMSMNSTLDDDFFEIMLGTNGTGANSIFVKNGSYSFGETITTTAAGGTQAPITVEGYASVRGDKPQASTRPLLNFAAATYSSGANWDFYNLEFTGTAASVHTLGPGGKVKTVKYTNTSTTADRIALSIGSDGYAFKCEAISYRGYAIRPNISSAGPSLDSCYIHNSKYGVFLNSTGGYSIRNSIIADNTDGAVYFNGVVATPSAFSDSTFYGAENKLGRGIHIFNSGVTDVILTNNIIYGFATGTEATSVQTVGFDDYNDFYNNTLDTFNWQKGNNTVALDPVFTNVTQITGTGATSATNVVTMSGADLSNVVDNQDFLHVVSMDGTGNVDNVMYLITAHDDGADTVTVSSNLTSSGAGSNIVWQITLGHDYSIGTNLKAGAYPGLFPGGLTTGYKDIGAVQRKEQAAGGSCSDPGVIVYGSVICGGQ